MNRSPQKVTLPPVWQTFIVVLVDEEFSGFFPDEKEHGESKAGKTQNEEVKRTASKNTINSGNIEEEDE